MYKQSSIGENTLRARLNIQSYVKFIQRTFKQQPVRRLLSAWNCTFALETRSWFVFFSSIIFKKKCLNFNWRERRVNDQKNNRVSFNFIIRSNYPRFRSKLQQFSKNSIDIDMHEKKKEKEGQILRDKPSAPLLQKINLKKFPFENSRTLPSSLK